MKYILIFSIFLVILIVGYFHFFNNALQFKNEVKVITDTTNSLRVSIQFELKEAAEACIQYWKEGDDQNFSYSMLSASNLKHTIRVVGLTGDTRYKFKVITRTDSGTKESEVGSFTSKSPPRGMLRIVWTKKPDFPFQGYILSQRQLGRSGSGHVYLVNEKGETSWYNKVQGLPKLSWWTESNTILVLSGNPKQERSAGDHILEFDLDGNELLNLDLSKLSIPLEVHHEVQYTSDGSLLTLAYDRKVINATSKGGKKDLEIKGDAIVRIDKSGKILWKWSVFDVLDPLKSTYAYDSVGEWGHANTLSVDQDGNYLLSFRDWNQIWKINSTDGKIIWKLGEGGDFELTKDMQFSGQHSVHKNLQGEYMMYDNGVKNKKSRVISFTIDESNKKATIKINIPLPSKLYSEKRGSAYFLDNKHILVCASEANSLAIIDLEGTILALAHTGLPDYYRAIFISELTPSHVNKNK